MRALRAGAIGLIGLFASELTGSAVGQDSQRVLQIGRGYDPAVKWRHEVRTDVMDDSTNCRVVPLQGRVGSPYVWFYYHSAEGASASVIGETYPGEQTTFRVDSNRAISGREGLRGGRLQPLVDQIRAGGKILRVRFIEWPSGAPVDLTFDLEGIVEHLDACRAAVR